jgi:hypothetical protein
VVGIQPKSMAGILPAKKKPPRGSLVEPSFHSGALTGSIN